MATEVILKVKRPMNYLGQQLQIGDEWKPKGHDQDKKILDNMIEVVLIPPKPAKKEEHVDPD